MISFLILLSCASTIAFGKPRAPLAVEIPIPQYQDLALENDRPIMDFAIENHNNVWMIGRTNLWLWKIDKKVLRRHRLKTRSPLQKLYLYNDRLYLTSRHSLFLMNPETNKIFRFHNPLAADTLAIEPVEADHNIFRWVQSRGVAAIDSDARTVRPLYHFPPINRVKVVYDASKETIFAIAQQRLIRYRLKRKPGDEANAREVLMRAKYPFQGIARAPLGFIANTRHTALVFDESGKLVQAIPAEGRAEILAMDIGRNTHGYLLSNGVVEIFRLRDKKKRFFRLEINRREAPTSFSIKDGLVATKSQNGIRVFRLPPLLQ